MKQKHLLTNSDCLLAAKHMIAVIHRHMIPMPAKPVRVFGVPRGGVPVAFLLLQSGDFVVVDEPEHADVIVDDIIDSGATRAQWNQRFPKMPFYALASFLPENLSDKWLVFPWEMGQQDTSADDICTRLLERIGEDPTREGLKDTPQRYIRAWDEMCVGYKKDPAEILKRDFPSHGYDQIIGCAFIEFFSMCEHHLLPFQGYAHVAYLPDNGPDARVVGLSKLARLVDCFGRRLQIQERMTQQVAQELEKHLKPRGVAVTIVAQHLCMACRGVQKNQSRMVTSAMRGVFLNDGVARDEYYKMIQLAQHGRD